MIISENGNKRTVVPILKIVWTRLISVCVIIPAPISTKNTLNITIAAMLKMIVPIILNNRCMIAAVFAFLLRTDTGHDRGHTSTDVLSHDDVDSRINGTSPAAARLCRIPTDADELWMIAVTPAPARIPRNGLCPNVTNRLRNISDS